MRNLTKGDKKILLKAMAAVGGGFYAVNIVTKMGYGRDPDYLITILWAITAAIFFGVILCILLMFGKNTK